MYQNSIEGMRKELSEKQFKRFKDLIRKFSGTDKLDLLYKIAKKRILLTKKLSEVK